MPWTGAWSKTGMLTALLTQPNVKRVQHHDNLASLIYLIIQFSAATESPAQHLSAVFLCPFRSLPLCHYVHRGCKAQFWELPSPGSLDTPWQCSYQSKLAELTCSYSKQQFHFTFRNVIQFLKTFSFSGKSIF